MREIDWSAELGRGIGVIELGAARDDVLRRMADAGLNEEADDDEPRWFYVEQMDAELAFTQGPNSVLEEIAISDDRLRLRPIQTVR